MRKKRNANLPLRLRVITTLTMLVMMSAIGILTYELYNFSQRYKNLINYNYQNISYMDEISIHLYQHEGLVLQLLAEDSYENDESESLLSEADMMHTSIDNTLADLGSRLKGTELETNYHSLLSGCNNYFKNVDYVYKFIEVGDKNTADYYVDLALNDSLKNVNSEISTMYKFTYDEMQTSRRSMDTSIALSYVLSVFSVVFIIILGIISITNISRIASDIAYRDSLTFVNNHDYVIKAGSRYAKRGRLWRFVFVSLSIKDFKYLNTTLGTDTCDHILREYAHGISEKLEEDELIGRSTGDNFILLLKKDNLDAFLEYIKLVNLPTTGDGSEKTVNIYSRCGIYKIQKNDDINTAMNCANLALNFARSSTVTDTMFYSDEMAATMTGQKSVTTEFNEALEKGEFVVYYQPKVDSRENMLCGAEALVRWVKDGKIVPPASFIPALESDGCITKLDFYVFEQVCKDMKAWSEKGIGNVRISSNFSKLHLQNPKLAENIISIIDKYGISHSLLEIELTESSGYDDFDVLKKLVDDLHQKNIHSSIDDFGTGYSSLSLIKELNVNDVKLDRSFLKDMEENTEDEISANFLKNIVHMVKDLGRSVIAEGAETGDQVTFLRDIGCNTIQGYFYSKPLPHDEFEEHLKSKHFNI